MEPTDQPDQPDAVVERLLRRSAPAPDRAFVGRLENRLFRARPAPAARRSWRPAFAAAGLAGGLASVALVLGLAGAGPLGEGDDAVKARDDCRYVTVTRTERVPAVVEDARGEPTVRFRKRRVERQVRRCG